MSFDPEIIKAVRSAQDTKYPPSETAMLNASRCLEAVQVLCGTERIRVVADVEGGLAVYVIRPLGYIALASDNEGDVVVSGKRGRDLDTWEVDRPVGVPGICEQLTNALTFMGPLA